MTVIEIFLAGGGGGCKDSGAITSGGSGGGGNGGANSPARESTAGTTNTGGGGGGERDAGDAKAGGSGVVYLSIPTSLYSGNNSGSPAVSTSGGSTIMKFTGSGSYVI